ncbi:MAG TPA: MarC family protein [Chitinophagaceae bacterium]|nr:MarC family protein [Chitinophagaceae bacterium]
MLSITQILTVTFTLFAIIDVLGSTPIFISLKQKTGSLSGAKASITSGIIMILFLLLGEKLLNVLGVDVSSFAIAGSIILFLMGLEMVLGVEFFKSNNDAGKAGSYVPVAFPLIAGSGALTTIISLKADFAFINILIGIIINMIVVYFVIRNLHRIEKMLGKSGLMVIRQFFGIILLAIAIRMFKSSIGL